MGPKSLRFCITLDICVDHTFLRSHFEMQYSLTMVLLLLCVLNGMTKRQRCMITSAFRDVLPIVPITFVVLALAISQRARYPCCHYTYLFKRNCLESGQILSKLFSDTVSDTLLLMRRDLMINT